MQDIILFLQNHILLTTGLAGILILLMMIEFIKARRATHHLTPLQVTQTINRQDDAIIVDLRSADAFANGHIVGSRSFPLTDLEYAMKKLEKNKSQSIVLICDSGVQSARVYATLQKKGFTKVYLLNGGIKAWRNAEMPLVKGIASNA